MAEERPVDAQRLLSIASSPEVRGAATVLAWPQDGDGSLVINKFDTRLSDRYYKYGIIALGLPAIPARYRQGREHGPDISHIVFSRRMGDSCMYVRIGMGRRGGKSLPFVEIGSFVISTLAV